MRILIALVMTTSLLGCTLPTLNSQTTDHSCNEMKKCCGCEGMEHCQKDGTGAPCCKPDDCKCKQITQR